MPGFGPGCLKVKRLNRGSWMGALDTTFMSWPSGCLACGVGSKDPWLRGSLERQAMGGNAGCSNSVLHSCDLSGCVSCPGTQHSLMPALCDMQSQLAPDKVERSPMLIDSKAIAVVNFSRKLGVNWKLGVKRQGRKSLPECPQKIQQSEFIMPHLA